MVFDAPRWVAWIHGFRCSMIFTAWAIADYTADPDAFVTGPLTIGAREEEIMDRATPALGNCDFEWISTDSNAVGSTPPDMAATMNGLTP